MNINKENWGAWLIDYFDGKLSGREEQMLMSFLDENPECKAEFDAFEAVSLEVPFVVFPEKDQLKKKEIVSVGGITEDNYERFFVLACDNELNEKQKVTLDKFLTKNSQLRKVLGLYGQILIKPDLSVVYPGKAMLKHQELVPLIRNFLFAAAAVFLLFVGVKFFMQNTKKPVREPIVQIQEIGNRALNAVQIDNQKVKAAFLGPPVAMAHKTKRQSMPEAHKIFSVIQAVSSRTAYFSLCEPLAYFDLRFPKGKVVKEHISITQPLMAETKKISKVKHTQPVTRVDGLLANKVQKRKKTLEKGRGFVKILDSGVTVINSLSNSDPVILVKTFDQHGNLLAYQLIGDQFNIHKNIKRSK